MIVLRAHYTMDVFTGVVVALLVGSYADRWVAADRSVARPSGVVIGCRQRHEMRHAHLLEEGRRLRRPALGVALDLAVALDERGRRSGCSRSRAGRCAAAVGKR